MRDLGICKLVTDVLEEVVFICDKGGREFGFKTVFLRQDTKLSCVPVFLPSLRFRLDQVVLYHPNFNLKRNILIRSITPHGVSDSLNICEVYC